MALSSTHVDNSQFSPNLRTSLSFWKLQDLSKLLFNFLISLSTWMSNRYLNYKMPELDLLFEI